VNAGDILQTWYPDSLIGSSLAITELGRWVAGFRCWSGEDCRPHV